jgi:hypothetical protein
VKAIVLSGYDNDPVIQNFEQYGFKGALPKPFLINDLSEIFSRIIGTDEKPKAKAYDESFDRKFGASEDHPPS